MRKNCAEINLYCFLGDKSEIPKFDTMEFHAFSSNIKLGCAAGNFFILEKMFIKKRNKIFGLQKNLI